MQRTLNGSILTKILEVKEVLVVAMPTVAVALPLHLIKINTLMTHQKQLRNIYCSLEFPLSPIINLKVVVIITVALWPTL